MRIIVIIASFLIIIPQTHGQMWKGQDTLYGNEWIPENVRVFKFYISQEGIYRIGYDGLVSANFPVESITGNKIKLYSNGKQIALHKSTAGLFTNSDFIEFVAKPNDGEIDAFLYSDAVNQQLNPDLSLFHDDRAYFLTWSDDPSLEYVVLENDLNDLPAFEESFIARITINFKEALVQTYQLFDNIRVSYSRHDKLEGFSTGFVGGLNQSFTTEIIAPELSMSEEDAKVKLRLAADDGGHLINIQWNGENVFESSIASLSLNDIEVDLPQIESENTLRLEGQMSNQDRYALSQIEFSYPRNFNFSEDEYLQMDLGHDSEVRAIQLENFGPSEAIILDPVNLERWTASLVNAMHPMRIPGDSNYRALRIIRESGIRTIEDIEEVDIIDYSNSTSNFILVSHKDLFNDAENGGANWLEAYQEYRQSEDGGNHSVEIVEINSLYDHFGYGQKRNPIAVRNFMHFIHQNWDVDYVMLIGKGRDYKDIRDVSDADLESFYIPTFGSPGADNLLGSFNLKEAPVIPLSRLAVSNASEIKDYLEKVKEFERELQSEATIADRAWQKRVIHMSGGDDEAHIIYPIVLALGGIIEDNAFGGEIDLFSKEQGNDETSISEQVINLVNDGTGIQTFFGHGSVNSTDFGIDNVNVLQNKGRYPLSFSLGCLTGNMHTEIQSLSESYVLAKDKGSIAYFASSGFGSISSLRTFSFDYYRYLGGECYGQAIGDVLQKVLQDNEGSNSITLRTLAEQFTLHGDPSLVMNIHDAPDYITDHNSLRVEPQIITSQQEKFQLSFDVYNLAKATDDSLDIRVIYNVPGRDEGLVIDKTILAPAFSTNVSIELALFGQQSVGKNAISIILDPNDQIPELPEIDAELNNQLVFDDGSNFFEFIVISNSVSAVYPEDFAIVHDEISLIATVSGQNEDDSEFYFQIDTTRNFKSPLLYQKVMNGSGGIIECNPDYNYLENSVYYWRVGSSSSPGDTSWSDRSFLFSGELESGWNQSHYFQFLQNDFQHLELDTTRNFLFDTVSNLITVSSLSSVGSHIERSTLFMNSERLAKFVRFGPTDDNNSLVMAVIQDPIELEPWENPPFGRYGSVNSGSSRTSFFFNTNTPEQRANLITFLRDTIPSGHYVSLFTGIWDDFPYDPEEWESDDTTDLATNLFTVLENQGAEEIRTLKNLGSVPFVFAYRKDVGPLAESIASSVSETLTVSYKINSLFEEAILSTELIGPLENKTQAIWSTLSEDSDIESVSIYGREQRNGEERLILSDSSGIVDLTHSDFEKYPFLRMEWKISDLIDRSASQLLQWYIVSDGVGDFAFNFGEYFESSADTLQQGEKIHLGFAVKNIGSSHLDSLELRYLLSDQEGNSLEWFEKQKPLEKGSSILIDIDTADFRLRNNVQLLIELNPGEKVLESNLNNNFFIRSLYMLPDVSAPKLSVLFDSQRIQNRDVVDPQTQISLILDDRDEFVLLNSADLFKYQIIQPDGQDYIFTNQDSVVFQKGTAQNSNTATLMLYPHFSKEGIYTLIAQAEDVSGNLSGPQAFEIQFTIDFDESVELIKAHPNPFSDITRISYSLLGNESPESAVVRIYDLLGKLVFEKEYRGDLIVGENRILIDWDGTGLNGSDLPNGVYFVELDMDDRYRLNLPFEAKRSKNVLQLVLQR